MSLDLIRNKHSWLTRILLVVLAGTFIIGFGYMGGINIGGGPTGGTAVVVNGERISLAQYYLMRDNIYRQYAQGRDDLPPQALDFIKFTALNRLVEIKLLAQQARELGFRVTENELGEYIRSLPYFQRDGEFIGAQDYQRIIKEGLNLTVTEFENGIRDELVLQKLVSLIDESAKFTDEELLNLYKIENEKVQLYYLIFPPADFSDSVEVSDNEIQEYYDSHISDFTTLELRKIKYIKASADDFKNGVQNSEEEIQSYYELYKDDFLKEDGSYSELNEVDDEINDTLASQKAKSIYDQFVERYSEDYSVESIEKISVEYSLDNIVESDFFNSQQKPDGIYTPVKNNAFNLNMGEVSISELGESVWIVELAEIIPENKKELDEVKPQIKKFISITKGKDAARIAAEETMKKLNDKKGSFKSSAKRMGLEIKETKYFTRLNPPNYLDQESLKIDAFLLTEENPMSSKIYNRGNNYFIVSLKDKKEVDKKEFEENRELIKQRELAKLKRDLLSKWIKKLYSVSKIVPNEKLFPVSG